MEVSTSASSFINIGRLSTSNADITDQPVAVNSGSLSLTRDDQGSNGSLSVSQSVEKVGQVVLAETFLETNNFLLNISPELTEARTDNGINRRLGTLTRESDEVVSRQEQLAEQEKVIEREIDRLQRREFELNRKRFQLEQQSNLGNFLNVQI